VSSVSSVEDVDFSEKTAPTCFQQLAKVGEVFNAKRN